MSLMLAESIRDDLLNIFDVITAVFSRGDTLAHPEGLVEALAKLHEVWAVVFIVAGLTSMLNGYKFYKIVVIVLAMGIGTFSGYYLGKQIESPYVVAGCLGLLFAIGCWPLMQYAVAMMGGLAGAFIGANGWSALARLLDAGNKTTADNYWIGALIGLIVFGMLAFILFKLSVVMFTSVSGATIAVLGAVTLLLQVPTWKQPIADSLSAHAVIMPLLVLVPAVIGLIMQETTPAKAEKKS